MIDQRSSTFGTRTYSYNVMPMELNERLQVAVKTDLSHFFRMRMVKVTGIAVWISLATNDSNTTCQNTAFDGQVSPSGPSLHTNVHSFRRLFRKPKTMISLMYDNNNNLAHEWYE